VQEGTDECKKAQEKMRATSYFFHIIPLAELYEKSMKSEHGLEKIYWSENELCEFETSIFFPIHNIDVDYYINYHCNYIDLVK
jgi:hypothetical protein